MADKKKKKLDNWIMGPNLYGICNWVSKHTKNITHPMSVDRVG